MFRSTVRISSSESKPKDRLEGKLEVLVIPEADQTKIYITVSTHTLAMAAVTAKSGAAKPDWASNIRIASAKHGHEVGVSISLNCASQKLQGIG